MRKKNDGKRDRCTFTFTRKKKKSLSILVILFSSCFFPVKIKWNHIVFLLKPNEITRIDYYNNWNYIHVYSISKRFNFSTKNNSFFFMPWLNGNRIIMSYSICIKNWKMCYRKFTCTYDYMNIHLCFNLKYWAKCKQLFVNISNI